MSNLSSSRDVAPPLKFRDRTAAISSSTSTVPTATSEKRRQDTELMGAEILTILDAFDYRHHNQHRASHWWAVFGIFRRSLRALFFDLNAPCSNHKARRLETRARWLREKILPRAYITFSQLAADNQFAPLGLLLLALLAQVYSLLAKSIPADIGPDNRVPSEHKILSGEPDKGACQDLDVGIAIPRKPSRARAKDLQEDVTADAAAAKQIARPLKAKGKYSESRKGSMATAKGDALSSLFDSLE